MKKQNWFIKNISRIISSTLFVVCAIIFLRTFVFDWSVVPSGSMSKTFLTGDVVINNKMAYGYYNLCSIPIIGVYFAKKKIIDLPKIQRGDIIVFCGKKDYITKRVIGLPGDIISWDNIDLTVNNESTILNQDGSFIYEMDQKYTLTKNHHDLNIDEIMTLRQSRIPLCNPGNLISNKKDVKLLKKYLKIITLHSDKYAKHPKITIKVPKGHVFIVGDNRFPVYSWDSRNHYFGYVCMSQITGKVQFRLFGSNAKVFNRNRSLLSNVILFPKLIIEYLGGLDFSRFGPVNTDFESAHVDDDVSKTYN